MTNSKRKLRRITKDKENAAKGKGKEPLQLDQKEQFIYTEAKQALAESKTNHQNIVAINDSIQDLSKMINSFDQKMAEYDKTDVQPQFKDLQQKNELLIDLLLRSEMELELTNDEIKILELEFEPEKEAEKEITDKDVVATSTNGKDKPTKKVDKKTKKQMVIAEK